MNPWWPTIINRGEVPRATVPPARDELRRLDCFLLEVRP
jgi:hypothetical protein